MQTDLESPILREDELLDPCLFCRIFILFQASLEDVSLFIPSTKSCQEALLLRLTVLCASALAFLNAIRFTIDIVVVYFFQAALRLFIARLHSSFHQGGLFLPPVPLLFGIVCSAALLIISSKCSVAASEVGKSAMCKLTSVLSVNVFQSALSMIHFCS